MTFPFVPACHTASLNAVIACSLFSLITTLFLPQNSTPLRTMLTGSLPIPLSLARLIVHPDSQSKMLDTVINSSVIALSYRSLATRRSVLAVRIAYPCFPRQRFKLGLSSRVSQVSAICDSSRPELQNLFRCPDTLPSTHDVHQPKNMSCDAFRSSRSASDGLPSRKL